MEKTNNNEKSKNEIKIGQTPKNKINIKKSKKAIKIKKEKRIKDEFTPSYI